MSMTWLYVLAPVIVIAIGYGIYMLIFSRGEDKKELEHSENVLKNVAKAKKSRRSVRNDDEYKRLRRKYTRRS